MFRFNYSESFIKILKEFAEKHSLEDRKTFKRSWIELTELKKDVFKKEIEKITEQGYTKDIEKKIFESIRYYYRKKILKNIQEPIINESHNQQTIIQSVTNKETNKETNKKQKLKGLSKEIKKTIDIQILETVHREVVSPAEAFDHFCNKYIQDLTEEIYRFKKITNKLLDSEELTNKFKKI